MKTVAIIQARMGSTRFPGKVMRAICGTPMIALLLERLSKAKLVDQIVLATSENTRNDSLSEYVQKLGYTVFRGSEDDVLDRYYQAGKKVSAECVVRITGDCPLIDPALVDEIIAQFIASDVDYASNKAPPTFPNGVDAEVFTFKSLEAAWNQTKVPRDREHVTPFIRESGNFSQVNIAHDVDYSGERWTVDEPEDFEVVQKVFEYFNPRNDFDWLDILALSEKHPEWFMANRHIARDEGSKIGTGQKLWKRARRSILGGGTFCAKRSENFLPGQWPAYFSKARGCKVWDLDGIEYIDMSIMGSGTNTLGYGRPEVDEAVRRAVDAGNMSTLNCPEEVYLAEKLIELHPWASQACFARSGSEAGNAALRIANAREENRKLAVCGYAGWQDQSPDDNPGDDENLNDNVYSFSQSSFASLEELIEKRDIGVIKIEVSQVNSPADGFLRNVRQLANKHNIVLIFDECTSGFRQSFGGLHKIYGVEPDMVVFGEVLGNGYSIGAVIGRKEIMEASRSAFIGGGLLVERVGLAASLKTLEIMEKEKSWEVITQTGRDLVFRLRALANKYDLPMAINGLPALASFVFDSSKSLAYKTLITQEMLGKGFLADNSIYACTAHSPDIVADFSEKLDPIFSLIKECEEGRDVMSLLKGPECHTGFEKLF